MGFQQESCYDKGENPGQMTTFRRSKSLATEVKLLAGFSKIFSQFILGWSNSQMAMAQNYQPPIAGWFSY